MSTDQNFPDVCEMLTRITSKDGKTNLYELLKKMNIVKGEINDEEKFDDLFEDISARIKQNGSYFPQMQNEEKLKAFLESYVKEAQKQKELLKPPIKIEPEQEPTPITQINFVPDYLDLFHRMAFANVSMGEKETMLLCNSIRNLAVNLPNGNVSFFGKINGTEKDYYIAEATEVDPPAEFNYDADMEKRKEDGVNRNVFYVTNDLCDKWVELPDIKPSQLIAARKIRYFFTGDLERSICSNPPFPGKEKDYLRCQIARIYHGAKLVPSINHYVIEDPESPFKQLVPNTEKVKPFTADALSDVRTWIHYPPGILQCGRVSHMLDPPEGVDPDEFKKKVLAKDPFDKRIKSIEEDEKIQIGSNRVVPWRLQQVYENMIYINPYIKLLDESDPNFDPSEQKDNTANYVTLCLTSLRWPGAYNFLIGKESYFFYFGWGQKFEDPNCDEPYVFKSFPTIPSDVPDKEDQPEPNGPDPVPESQLKEGEGEKKKGEEEKKEGEGDGENKEGEEGENKEGEGDEEGEENNEEEEK